MLVQDHPFTVLLSGWWFQQPTAPEQWMRKSSRGVITQTCRVGTQLLKRWQNHTHRTLLACNFYWLRYISLCLHHIISLLPCWIIIVCHIILIHNVLLHLQFSRFMLCTKWSALSHLRSGLSYNYLCLRFNRFVTRTSASKFIRMKQNAHNETLKNMEHGLR